MTLHPIGTGIIATAGTAHNKFPVWIEERLGYTAELPDGTSVGSRMQAASDHILRYRLAGLAHLSYYPSDGDEGTIYIPIHYPPLPDGGDRELLVRFYGTANASAAWEIKYRDGADGGLGTGAYTSIASGDIYDGGPIEYVFCFPYTPPTGTNGNSFKAIEIYCHNVRPITVSAYHIGELQSSDANLNVPDGACSPGMIIADTSTSLSGLIELVGTGAVDAERMERVTRRQFFGGSHVDGVYCDEGDEVYYNLFTELKFAARSRDLLGDGLAKDCYPVFVASAEGVDNGTDEVILKVENLNGDSWTYTFQDADGTSPILIHPWRTGSSSADGIPVTSSQDDLITISAKTYAISGGGTTKINLHAWALFEGPAY